MWLEGKQCNFILSSSDDDFLDMLPHSSSLFLFSDYDYDEFQFDSGAGKKKSVKDASRISLAREKKKLKFKNNAVLHHRLVSPS